MMSKLSLNEIQTLINKRDKKLAITASKHEHYNVLDVFWGELPIVSTYTCYAPISQRIHRLALRYFSMTKVISLQQIIDRWDGVV